MSKSKQQSSKQQPSSKSKLSKQSSRVVAPVHTCKTCSRSILRRWFYAGLVQSRFSLFSKPSRAFVKWYAKRADERFKQSPYNDLERSSAAKYCIGKGIDVGCGSNKTVPTAIGVDITPKGSYGFAGSQLFERCQADVVTSGDNLPMFKQNSLDYVVARHNLEHYQDPIKTLLEWRRVLKPGGLLILTLPDDEAVDTIHLDESHYHVFTQDSAARLLKTIGGFKIVKVAPAIPNWSFIVVARKL